MIKLNRPSSSISQLFVSPETRVATVTFKSTGSTQTYTDLNGGDIDNLLSDSTVSVGKWVNQVCLGRSAGNQVSAA